MGFSSNPIQSSPAEHFDYLTSGCTDPEIQFLGKGFDRLNLGAIDSTLGRELFLTFGEGATPADGQVIQTNNGKHIAGIDCMWSAPKWASALMAISTPAERALIQTAWDEHVELMFNRLEQRAKVCRPVAADQTCTRTTRRQGSKTERVEGDLIGFVAKHHTARPTQETDDRGDPPDPHLHTHIFIFNMAWVHDLKNAKGGKWRGVDDSGIKAQAEQMLYESEGDFVRRMEDLGYRPQYVEDKRGRHRSKMDELTDLCNFWSSNKRRTEKLIEDYLQKWLKPPSEKQLRKLMVWTRQAKDKAQERVVDWTALLSRAILNGFSDETPEREGPLERESFEDRRLTLFQRLSEPNGLCHNDAEFNHRSIVTSIARCAVGLGFTCEDLDQFRIEIEAELVPIVEDPKLDRCTWTTRTNLNDEWLIHRLIEEKVNQVYAQPSPDAVDRAIAELSTRGIDLDAEQIEMLNHMLSSAGVVFCEGYAGTGKTQTGVGAVLALKDKLSTGMAMVDEVIAISTAKDTALRTGDKLDAQHKDSIESFCTGVRFKRIKPTERTVIFLDESVMVDNSRMARLLKAAGPAKIICIGDREQLQPIGAGGWYPDAVNIHGCKTLTKVHRQENEEDIKALFNLRSGKAALTLESLRSRDRVHIAENRAELIGQVIRDYIGDRDSGRGVNDVRIVLDGRNTEIDMVNRIIQIDRLDRGELTGEGVKVYEEKSQREWTLYVGDEISFIEGYSDFEANIKIANGSRARITAIDHEAQTMTLYRPDKDRSETMPILPVATPCYGVHAMRLQGGEAPIIRAMPGMESTSLEAGYSQASRCIEEIHLYLDEETHGGDAGLLQPIWAITQRWKTSEPKISARTKLKRAKARAGRCATPSEEIVVEDHLDLGPQTIPVDQVPYSTQRAPWKYEKRQRRFTVDSMGIGREL